MSTEISPANVEAIEASNGVLFDRFGQFRDIVMRNAQAAARAERQPDGDQAKELESEIAAALREELAVFELPDGVRGTASTWIVTARVPQAGASGQPSTNEPSCPVPPGGGLSRTLPRFGALPPPPLGVTIPARCCLSR